MTHAFKVSDIGVTMERKRAFQMREKFERCKTPMGAVPISVIMGFDYPIGNFGNIFFSPEYYFICIVYEGNVQILEIS